MAKGRTLIATIHDLRFIEDYDWVICLDHGLVAGQGTHESLIETCEIYRELLDWERKLGVLKMPSKTKK